MGTLQLENGLESFSPPSLPLLTRLPSQLQKRFWIGLRLEEPILRTFFISINGGGRSVKITFLQKLFRLIVVAFGGGLESLFFEGFGDRSFDGQCFPVEHFAFNEQQLRLSLLLDYSGRDSNARGRLQGGEDVDGNVCG